MGVEAAVGPHRPPAPGSNIAHPAQGLTREVDDAPRGDGPALPQPGQQQLASADGIVEEPADRVNHHIAAGHEVVVPPLQGQGLADTQPGPPRDERRHPGAAEPQSPQGVQELLDLLGVPVVRNYHMGTFTSIVPIRAI